MTTPRISSSSIGAALWLLTWLVVSTLLFVNGLSRSVTTIYHLAVDHWNDGQALYYGPKEFNYLPAFVGLFRPFHSLPIPLGDILWRLAAVLGFVVGIHQVSRLPPLREHRGATLMVTLLALPLSVSALRNGQSSAHIGALFVLAASALSQKKWNLAALFLSLSLVCKPLVIPFMGLAFMLFPNMGWRLALGSLAVFVVPYAWADADYVNGQYLLFHRNIVDCMTPTVGRVFADINGILRIFDYELDRGPYFQSQVAVGLSFAALCFFSRKGLSDFQKILALLGLGGAYIMLFTPMNEANSYVMVAPAVALWACWYKYNDKAGMFYLLVAMLLVMIFGANIVAPILDRSQINEYNQTINPLMILVFVTIVVGQLLAMKRSRNIASAPGTRDPG